MPSDVLQALLGVLAGGATGYENKKEQLRQEGIAAKTRAEEIKSKKDLLTTQLTAAAAEGKAGRLSDKEIAVLKLQGDRDNLHEQLKQNLEISNRSNAIDRERLQVQRDEITSKIDEVDKQIAFETKKLGVESGLKNKELNIDQAYKIGTGPLGNGSRLGPGGKGIGGSAKFWQDNPGLIGELSKGYVSGRADRLKPGEFFGFLHTLLNTDFMDHPTPPGILPPPPPDNTVTDSSNLYPGANDNLSESFKKIGNLMNIGNPNRNYRGEDIGSLMANLNQSSPGFPDMSALLEGLHPSSPQGIGPLLNTITSPKKIKTLKGH